VGSAHPTKIHRLSAVDFLVSRPPSPRYAHGAVGSALNYVDCNICVISGLWLILADLSDNEEPQKFADCAADIRFAGWSV
jgi:hypothetical protein